MDEGDGGSRRCEWCSIDCGWKGKERQREAWREGRVWDEEIGRGGRSWGDGLGRGDGVVEGWNGIGGVNRRALVLQWWRSGLLQGVGGVGVGGGGGGGSHGETLL